MAVRDLPASPLVKKVGGVLAVEWPSGMPEEGWFAITPELFLSLVGEINDLRMELEACRGT
jgi:hypothetical protein